MLEIEPHGRRFLVISDNGRGGGGGLAVYMDVAGEETPAFRSQR